MFDSGGNIQGWPTPTLFIRMGWKIRSWYEYTTNRASLISVTLFLAVVQGAAAAMTGANVSAACTSAVYFLAIVQGAAISTGQSTVTVAMQSLTYFLTVVQGAAVNIGAASVSVALITFDYISVVKQGTPAGGDENELAQTVTLTSVLYV